MISPDQQTAISDQEMKIKTLPKSILNSKFKQEKKEQTETIEKVKRLEMTDKEEGRLPDDIMKQNVSEIPGSEKEKILKVKTDNNEGRVPEDIMKQNESGMSGSEKEQTLELKTDKEEKRDIIKQNQSKTPESENLKRLEMKIVEDEGKIHENECEIPEPEYYPSRSLSSEFNDKIEIASDEPCNTSMKTGEFVLARFSNKRNKEYRFVCRIEDISHGKIVVQGFKSKKMKNIYVTIKNDISIIENEDIVEFLTQPKKEGNCYIFPSDINVKEI